MINKAKIIYIFIFIGFLAIPVDDLSAQLWTPCIDTIRQVNPYHNCDYNYQPVCGCNGITYRNECVAYWQNAVNISDNGICGDIDLFLLDNFVSEYIEFAVYLRNFGSVNIAIYDVYGTMYYFDNISNFIKKQERQIPVQHLRHGVYFLVVFYNDVANTRKFVREPNY